MKLKVNEMDRREGTDTPSSGRRTVVKAIASILLAYPLSGAIYAISGFVKLAFTAPAPLENIGIDFLMIALWMVMVPACEGFVPQNEGDVGARINMYPWIVPTAVTLFVLLSKGWRWFRRDQ